MSHQGMIGRPALLGAIAAGFVLFAVPISAAASTAAGAATTSRGFDGKTIKVAGIYNASNFAGAEVGAQAVFKQVNATNYLKGVKIQFVGMQNDQGDPATALTEMRQLVTQDQIFAVVPDLSSVNPQQYL